MQPGNVIGIYIASKESVPTISVNEVRAQPGHGLEGDRYFDHAGTFSRKDGPEREITLIESEALEALRRDYQIELSAGETRRNLLTRGVALNHLVGKEFQVGEVRLRGIRLCEPCGHLEKLTKPGVKTGLVHRGGLRAQILSAGVIHAGDVIKTD